MSSLEYTVTADGRAENVRATKSDVIGATERSVIAVQRKARFRPRFVEGKPVSAAGVHVRQLVYARDPGEYRSPTVSDSPPPKQTRASGFHRRLTRSSHLLEMTFDFGTGAAEITLAA